MVGAVDLTHLLAWDWIKRALLWCRTGSRRVYYLWHTCRSQHMLCYWLMIQTVCKNILEELTSGKKAVGEQTCSLQLQMIMFPFSIYTVWPEFLITLFYGRGLSSFVATLSNTLNFMRMRTFRRKTVKRKKKGGSGLSSSCPDIGVQAVLIYTVGSYLHGKDISETKGTDKYKCKGARSSFFSYTVCFLF